MALEYPKYSDLINITQAALRNTIPGLDPTVSNSWALAFVDSIAAVSHSNNLQIRDLETELFPQGATGIYLDRWLEYEALSRNAASSGRGNTAITGIEGGVVPLLTEYTSTNGLLYKTQEVGAIVDTTLTLSTLTRIGTTATACFTESHGMSSGMTVEIAGADQPDYNGSFEIAVTSETDFTYNVTGSPSAPATGSITASAAYATVKIECTTTGDATNLDSGAIFTISVPIANVDDISIVGAEGLTGGGAVEDDESARTRLFLSRADRSGIFTPDQIKLAVLSINGNTRVWVVSPQFPTETGGPVAGQVFVYFLRDNDSNPLPSSTLIEEAKTAIIEDGALPANTVEEDVVVSAPIPVYTDFIFTAISPNTITMQNSITAQLQAFFEDSTQLSTDISESKYIAAIANTIDTDTGDELESFTLSAPLGDITINFGEIGLLGDVTYP